ncbi:MAG TPA: SIMPL domain-containing protein [Acidobacteriaceae bacterium]|nr:SIMPL domain-containing protein [Acidobacteriaceae bacterium]
MAIPMRKIVAALSLLILLIMAAPGLRLRAQEVAVNKDNRTIAVTTSADATADADTAIVQVGFLAYGPDEHAAYANGSRISNAIVHALTEAGVAADAMQSENQSILPVQQYAGQDWTPEEKVERKFQVQQSWTVKTGAKNAAMVLDVAVKAGANQSGQIEWTIADDDPLQARAAGLALARARQIAQQMAQGLGAALGPLLYASNEAPPRRVEPMMRSLAVGGAPAPAEKVEPLSIAARKVTRSATVHAMFAIQ